MIHGNACLAYFNKMWDISLAIAIPDRIKASTTFKSAARVSLIVWKFHLQRTAS